MKSIPEAISHFQKEHFSKVEHFGYYCFIVGGSIRDFLLDEKSKDIDLFFQKHEHKDEVAQYFIDQGYEVTKSYETVTTVQNSDGLIYDVACREKFPDRLINTSDFSVASCAIDSTGSFFCHDSFLKDLENRELVVNNLLDSYFGWGILEKIRRLRKL